MNYALLKNSKLFSGMSEEEIEAILNCLSANTLKKEKGSFILRSGKTERSMGILLSGKAIVHQEDVWGDRNIMSGLEAGDSFAEPFAILGTLPLNINVEAVTDVEILFIDVQRILHVCSNVCSFHARVIENLVTIMAEKLIVLNRKITHISRKSTREKVMSYLSAESQRTGRLSFDIPFNRQQMADYLCVDRAAMSVVLSELKRERIIDYSKNHFELYL